MEVTIRQLNENDAKIISQAFSDQGWRKPEEQYVRYFREQQAGERVTLIAEADGHFAGYVNVLWQSYYPLFRERQIPEVNDFNVLIKYRRLGIGSKLMERAEAIIGQRSDVAGIGVGLFADYGPAQAMYVKRGYVPDARGIWGNEKYASYGDSIVIDDDIALYLTKKLK